MARRRSAYRLRDMGRPHRQLTDDQLRGAGVGPELVRISVGLEDVDDILWDLDQALTLATGRER